ncbi:MAG: hypothetical protein QXQ76_02725, partial [Candidatus Bathyarchaeia archaeon]
HDGGSFPKSDDYRFNFLWTTPTTSKFYMWKGAGDGWQKADGKIAELVPVPGSQAASSLAPSPRSSSPHMIYEFKIPKAIFAASPETIGFAAAVWHNPLRKSPAEVLLTWPKDYLRDVPATWGDLTLSTVPIPELSPPGLGLASMIALAASLLAWRRLGRSRMRG